MEQRPLEKLCKEKLPTKITLEPLGLKHLKTVHEYASDLENTRYMVHLPNETIEETNLLVGFCKKELNIHRFIAVCDTENVGSYRVMEKLGMKRVNERGGRKNRASEEFSREYRYEM